MKENWTITAAEGGNLGDFFQAHKKWLSIIVVGLLIWSTIR